MHTEDIATMISDNCGCHVNETLLFVCFLIICDFVIVIVILLVTVQFIFYSIIRAIVIGN